MKLDRNINPDGRGKYALLKIRKLHQPGVVWAADVLEAVKILDKEGLIHWGSEGPGEQFFVMKYKDRFTHYALRSYANHVEAHAMLPVADAQRLKLMEYAAEIHKEATAASNHGNRIPD